MVPFFLLGSHVIIAINGVQEQNAQAYTGGREAPHKIT